MWRQPDDSRHRHTRRLTFPIHIVWMTWNQLICLMPWRAVCAPGSGSASALSGHEYSQPGTGSYVPISCDPAVLSGVGSGKDSEGCDESATTGAVPHYFNKVNRKEDGRDWARTYCAFPDKMPGATIGRQVPPMNNHGAAHPPFVL